MHKSESVIQDEMHKILWEFEIQMDPLILTRSDIGLIDKKENLLSHEFCSSVDHKGKI